jgi:hypothetical protein
LGNLLPRRLDATIVGTQGTRDVFIGQLHAASIYAEANPCDW